MSDDGHATTRTLVVAPQSGEPVRLVITATTGDSVTNATAAETNRGVVAQLWQWLVRFGQRLHELVMQLGGNANLARVIDTAFERTGTSIPNYLSVSLSVVGALG